MHKKIGLILFLSAMFIFRLVLAVNAKHGDMYNNLDWGHGAVKYGLAQFYDLPKEVWPHSRPNQPPGSIYLHLASVSLSTATNQLINWLNDKVPVFPSKLVWWWDWNGDLVSIKLPSIIADFAILAAILRFGKLFNRRKFSLIIGIVYLLNPALWYNSAFWGHTDAVVAALSVWSFLMLLEKRLMLSAVLLGISFITKASWLFIVPIYGLYFLINFSKKIYLTLFIPLTMFLFTLPFHTNVYTFIPWFWDLYFHRILAGESAFITVIAFNFWNLIFAPDFVYYKTLFFGIPANIVGWGIVALLLVVLVTRLCRKPSPQIFIWTSLLLSFSVFLFAPKMIHRYLYPAFPLISIALLFVKHKKVLWTAYVIMSACYLINLYYKWWAPGNLWLQSFYTDSNTKIISVIYLAVFVILFIIPLSYVQKD